MRSIGILGGTFDPIHCGHLRLAIEIRERAKLDELLLIPARLPALRDTPRVDSRLRLDMLRAAVVEFEGLAVDDRELHRPGPSFTIDTLLELRAENPETALCLILGMDAFVKLEQWHRWREITKYCNIAVATRPGIDAEREASDTLSELVTRHKDRPVEALSQAQHGLIKVVEIPMLDISATYIRKQIAQGKDVRLLTPSPVIQLIEEHRLYGHGQ